MIQPAVQNQVLDVIIWLTGLLRYLVREHAVIRCE